MSISLRNGAHLKKGDTVYYGPKHLPVRFVGHGSWDGMNEANVMLVSFGGVTTTVLHSYLHLHPKRRTK